MQRCTASRLRQRAGKGLAAVALLVACGVEATAAETGDLRIVSQPGVEVIWEGVPLGETDANGVIEIFSIPLGAYEVLLRKQGHESRTVSLEVTPGLRIVSLPLTRSAPPAEPVERRAQTRTAEPPPTPPPPAEPPRPKPGASPVEVAPGPLPEPAPETPAAPPQPAGDDAPAEAPGGGSWPMITMFAALAAALMILAVWRFRAGSTPAEAVTPPAREPSHPEEPILKSIGQADVSALREEVRRREQILEKSRPTGRRARPEVIDVDDFEIIEDKK